VAGLVIARSHVQIPPVATVYQRQLSVPSLRGRLMSSGVNGHATRCISGLLASANETAISNDEAREGLY